MEYQPKVNAKFNNLLSQSMEEVKIEDLKKQFNEKEKLEDVMKDLEEKVNPKSLNEGIAMLVTAIETKDQKCILGPMERGAKEFEERVGRPMTYSEMRAMWG